MEVKNQIRIAIPENEKACFVCDVDMPLGEIYDLSCRFKAFIFAKIQEAQAAEDAKKPPEAPENVDQTAPEAQI